MKLFIFGIIFISVILPFLSGIGDLIVGFFTYLCNIISAASHKLEYKLAKDLVDAEEINEIGFKIEEEESVENTDDEIL